MNPSFARNQKEPNPTHETASARMWRVRVPGGGRGEIEGRKESWKITLCSINFQTWVKTQTLTESIPLEIKSAVLVLVSSRLSPPICCHLRETHRSWIKVTFGKRCHYDLHCAPEMCNSTHRATLLLQHQPPPAPRFTFNFPLRWGQSQSLFFFSLKIKEEKHK